MALTIAVSPGGILSNVISASVTSPAISQVLVDTGPLSAGNGQPQAYIAQVCTVLTGTADAAGGGSNIFLNVGGTSGGSPLVVSGGDTFGNLLSLPVMVFQRFRVVVNSGERIFVCVGNNTPTAGAIYNVSLTVTKATDFYADT